MEKQEARQAEMDARYEEGISWRSKTRAEDVEWREMNRRDDKEWRQSVREEDKEWRQSVREEDKEWRRIVREEELRWRTRNHRTAMRCCALTSAAQSARRGASPEEIFELAQKFEGWLEQGLTDD